MVGLYCCAATPPVLPSPLTNVCGIAADLTLVNGITRAIDNDWGLAIEIVVRMQIGRAVSQLDVRLLGSLLLVTEHQYPLSRLASERQEDVEKETTS